MLTRTQRALSWFRDLFDLGTPDNAVDPRPFVTVLPSGTRLARMTAPGMIKCLNRGLDGDLPEMLVWVRCDRIAEVARDFRALANGLEASR